MNDTDEFDALVADRTDPADDAALAAAQEDRRARQPATLALMLGLLSIPLGLVVIGGLFAAVGLVVGLRHLARGGAALGTAIGGVVASVLGLATTAVSVLAIVMAVAAAKLGPQAAAQTAAWADGRPAPAWRFEALDGQVLDAADFRGRVVLLDLWATWCKPCKSMIPVLAQVAGERPDDLAVIGVSVEHEDAETVRAFVARERVPYPVAIANPAALPEPLRQVQVLPTLVVFDRAGRIVAATSGAHDLATIRALLEAADR